MNGILNLFSVTIPVWLIAVSISCQPVSPPETFDGNRAYELPTVQMDLGLLDAVVYCRCERSPGRRGNLRYRRSIAIGTLITTVAALEAGYLSL